MPTSNESPSDRVAVLRGRVANVHAREPHIAPEPSDATAFARLEAENAALTAQLERQRQELAMLAALLGHEQSLHEGSVAALTAERARRLADLDALERLAAESAARARRDATLIEELEAELDAASEYAFRASSASLAARAMRAMRGRRDDTERVRASVMFDAAWYAKAYPDVAASGMDPVHHYLLFGAAEGRDPSPRFDTRFYLGSNADVAASGVNPLVHYLSNGRREGRLPAPARSPR